MCYLQLLQPDWTKTDPDWHTRTRTNTQTSAGRSPGCLSKTQRPDRTLARSFKDIPTVIGEPAADKDRMHTGLLSAESTHLPALKHFNHLTANYSGARQSRTETHTSLPQHSQMALQAGSPLPVFTLPVKSANTVPFWYGWKSKEIQCLARL